MKQIVIIISLCWALVACENGDSKYAIPPTEFEKAVATPQAQVLDVRTAAEFQTGHLEHAMHADWKNQQEFTERTAQLDKSKPVFVYCAAGPRSTAAGDVLRKQGYNVTELKGGIKEWVAAKKPVHQLHNETPISLAEYRVMTTLAPVVLVDFGADWCPPCKTMDPVIAQLEAENKGAVKVVKIDAGLQMELLKKVNGEKIPTFIVYRNGIESWRKEGIVSRAELDNQLK